MQNSFHLIPSFLYQFQVSRREEPFLDLSLDLDQNISLNYCLKKYSNVEVLKDSDKFACNNCNVLQTAEKRYVRKEVWSYFE